MLTKTKLESKKNPGVIFLKKVDYIYIICIILHYMILYCIISYYIYICLYVCIHMYLCMCIYIYIHIHICIHNCTDYVIANTATILHDLFAIKAVEMSMYIHVYILLL